MPFDTDGVFTNVAGATTAVAGQIVQSAVWDNIHTDYGDAFTMVMSQLISSVTNRNALYMNGGLEVWQRGAGSAASIAVPQNTTAYTADRWYLITGATQASIVSAQTGLTNGSNLAAKIIRNAAQTGVTLQTFGYPLDTDEIYRLRGSKVSLTVTLKAGANWSPTSGTLNLIFAVGTGAVAKRGAGFTTETVVINTSTNLTPAGSATTVQVSSTVVVPITSTQAEFQVTWTPVGTAGADDSFYIDDVQIEAQLSGSTWTPTDFDRIPFAPMLAACQRHYAKTPAYGRAPADGGGGGVAGISAYAQAVARTSCVWMYPTRMRVTPSVTTYNPSLTGAGNIGNFTNEQTSLSVVASIDPNGYKNDMGVQIISATVTTQDQTLIIDITASAGI